MYCSVQYSKRACGEKEETPKVEKGKSTGIEHRKLRRSKKQKQARWGGVVSEMSILCSKKKKKSREAGGKWSEVK